MSQAVPAELRATALELHRLLKDIDPARFRDDLHAAARERLEGIATRLNALRATAAADPRLASLHARLQELAERLEASRPRLNLPAPELRAEWARFRQQVGPAYEHLVHALRDYRVHVPSLRPTNYKRNAFHVSWALFVVWLIEWVATSGQLMWLALATGVWAWGMEITRRVWPSTNKWIALPFKPFLHPHEMHQVNSATWYVTALILLSLTGNPVVQVTAVVVLGFADPAAAIVGRRFGRVKLINGRSLEGSLAFLVVGALMAFAALQLFHPEVALGAAAAVAATGALFGAVAELVSKRIDDNFTIPVAAALGGMLAASLANLPAITPPF